MALARFLLLLCLFFFHAYSLTDEERQHIVDEHNRFRREAGAPNMRMMEYDTRLECVAQAYIETQSNGFTHNPDRTTDYASCGGEGSVGENWFSGSHEQATDFWTNGICCGETCSEKDNYIDSSCNGVVGHYTQIMWATSYKVGCGYTPEGGTVCNYSPAGNSGGDAWDGAPQIDQGNECSSCVELYNDTHPHCFEGLCSATEDGSAPNRGGGGGGNGDDDMNRGAAYFLIIAFACIGCTFVLVLVVGVVAIFAVLALGGGFTGAIGSGKIELGGAS